MRNEVIAAIEAYAPKNGMYYSYKELLNMSNKELLEILLEEHADYISAVILKTP